MVSTSADSHAVSPVPERHCCVCWIIACIRLESRRPTRSGTNRLTENPFRTVPEKTSDNVICFTNDPSDPL